MKNQSKQWFVGFCCMASVFCITNVASMLKIVITPSTSCTTLQQIKIDDVTPENNDDVTPENNEVLPQHIIYNIGPGTTATHAAYKATCRLGMPSIHYRRICTNPLKTIPIPLRKSAGIQNEILHHWRSPDRCLRRGECREGEVEQFLPKLKRLFVAILQQNDIMAYHDVPYSTFPEIFLEAFNETWGVLPNIIMSERDPHKWAISRLSNHPDFVCRDNYDQVDLHGCIRRAMAKANKGNTTTLTFKDVFVGFAKRPKSEILNFTSPNATIKCIQGDDHRLEDLVRGAEEGMKRYIHENHSKAVYTMNLFEREERTPIRTVAAEIRSCLPFCHNSTLCEIMTPFKTNEHISDFVSQQITDILPDVARNESDFLQNETIVEAML